MINENNDVFTMEDEPIASVMQDMRKGSKWLSAFLENYRPPLDVYALEIIIPVAFRLNTYNTHLFRTWLVGKALSQEKRQAYVMFIQNGKTGYC